MTVTCTSKIITSSRQHQALVFRVTVRFPSKTCCGSNYPLQKGKNVMQKYISSSRCVISDRESMSISISSFSISRSHEKKILITIITTTLQWRNLLEQNKKRRESGEKCHTMTMMLSEAGEAYKMSTHHLPLTQSIKKWEKIFVSF